MSKEVNNSQHSRKVGVNRGVAALTALLLATGCVATEGGQVQAKIIDEPTKTSPLSPDLTKTPAPLSTEANYELIPTVVNPATQELTLVSPTEIAPNDFIKINMDNIIYPPMGSVKENFEKGEYDASVETIKQWVSVWDKMNLFENNDDINGKSFVLVPLAGTEKVTCVALESDKYTKTLYCPPVDNNTGGLKIISNSGQGQETDKPIIVKLTGTEGLTTRGKGDELTYQIADKYTGKAIKYYDIKSKTFVEGSYLASMEVKENIPIKCSIECVADEFCMGGQMTVDQEIGKIFYEKYMKSLISNWANKDYFTKLLGDEPTYQKLQTYLDKNNGYVPAGLRLLSRTGGVRVNMSFISEKPINLSYLKTIVIGPIQWHNNTAGIQEYLNSYDKNAIINPYETVYGEVVYFGWFLDKDNALVLVNGSLNSAPDWPNTLGGSNGEYLPERDNMVASGYALSFIVYNEKHLDKYDDMIVPFYGDPYYSSPQVSDIGRLLGGNLFKNR